MKVPNVCAFGTRNRPDQVPGVAVGPSAGWRWGWNELVSSRLAPNGVFVQWIPRAASSTASGVGVPLRGHYGEVPECNHSKLLIASNQPLFFDRPTLRKRLSKVDLESAFDPQQRWGLIEFFENADTKRQPKQPRKIARLAPEYFNHDLHPRDEYFLNDNWPEER